MFNISQAQKDKAKEQAILAKEKVLYGILLSLGIDPDSIQPGENITLPTEEEIAMGTGSDFGFNLIGLKYAPSVVAYNLIEELNTLKGL